MNYIIPIGFATLSCRNRTRLSSHMMDRIVSDSELLQMFRGMYDGDRDTDTRCLTVRVVRTRKEHSCIGLQHSDWHKVSAGSRMVMEKAIIDGKWRSAYTCEKHIFEFMRLGMI